MVFSLEHDIKVTKNHKNLLPTQTVIVTHRVVLSTVSFAYLKSELNWISSHKIISSVASKTVTEIARFTSNIFKTRSKFGYFGRNDADSLP
jgi:hypothetical protein